MKVDAEIKKEGYNALFDKMRPVDVERFIAVIKQEGFDYTQWRKDLWEDLSVEELSHRATSHVRQG